MKELIKGLISYLRELLKAKEICERDVCQYFRKSIEGLFYKSKHRSVIKRGVIISGSNLSIRYNCIASCKPKRNKNKARRKEALLDWSKRIVAYQKRLRYLQKHNTEQAKLQPEELQKLNERLENYKNNSINKKQSNSECISETVETHNEEANSKPESNQNDIDIESSEKSSLAGSKQRFLDVLISKLNTDKGQSTVVDNLKRIATKSTVNISKNSKVPEDIDESESSSSSDFFGFNEKENTIGLLPTPIVPKHYQSLQSPFVSERLNRFLKENSLEDRAQIELPKVQNFEEGLVCEGARPPKILMPKIPNEIGRARTVAEKRMFLERKKSIKYYIIENENTIYREIKKRSKHGTSNDSLIEHLQNSEVPFTRDCWRATSWLRTANGKFYFQTLSVDDTKYKLIGGRGNHDCRSMGLQQSVPPLKKRLMYCSSDCKQDDVLADIVLPQLNNSKIIHSKSVDDESSAVEPKKKHPRLLSNELISTKKTKAFKPGPLSVKCLPYADNKIDVGDVEVYKMPQVQLEVFPEINQPLDECVKPYLKLLLPSKKITKEWAEFSVSTLVTKYSKEIAAADISPLKMKSYVFKIPYLNDQTTILVRKIPKRNERYDSESKQQMSFQKKIDTNNPMEVDCGNLLSEMIDSVALSLSEDTFIKNDPDIDYEQNTIENKIAGPPIMSEAERVNKYHMSPNQAPPKQLRLLKELKRLNATIVQAEENSGAETATCKNDFCRLGCICQSLAGVTFWKPHCKKVGCMLNCVCDNNISHYNTMNNALSEEDAILIREKATASLAKVEKEFCATLVLTGSETYLLNDSNTEKRRMKRIPKRFQGFVKDDVNNVELGGDMNGTNSPKTTPTKKSAASSKFFKHCNVAMRRLKHLENIEPWCMIHCLYKCFCNGKALEGEPFTVKKKEATEEEEVVYSRKRRYSFDKDEKTASETRSLSPKRAYFVAGYVSGSRCVEIPAKRFQEEHRNKLAAVKAKASAEETMAKGELLKKRICNSGIAYNRSHKSTSKTDTETVCKPVPTNVPKSTPRNTIKTIAPAPSSIVAMTVPTLAPISEFIKKTDSTKTSSKREKQSLQSESNEKPVVKPLVDINAFEREFANSNAPVIKNYMQKNFPVISSVQSLNPTSGNSRATATTTLLPSDFQTMQMKCSSKANSAEKFHQNAIVKLNAAVTKTMQSICAIQKRNSKNIPLPAARTLSSLQWRFFLQAFVEGLVFVWVVWVNDRKIIVATKRNAMPQVTDALGATNIRALPRDNLPLIGKMLIDELFTDKMKMLSVLMSGHDDYWHIIGFLNSDQDYLTQRCIIRPTPETHPQVSSKVNALYKLLFMREVNIFSQQPKIKPKLESPKTIVRKPVTVPVKTTKSENVGIPPNQLPLSNLRIQHFNHTQADSIIIPLPVKQDHFWLMLSVIDDFSHIYIPEWKNFLSYDRIKKAMGIASANKKTVRLGKISGDVDIFATAVSNEVIYIGPYYTEVTPNLILYQNIDGRMMLRENFENSLNLKRQKSTVGYWLRIKDSALVYEEVEERSNDTLLPELQEPVAAKSMKSAGEKSSNHGPPVLCISSAINKPISVVRPTMSKTVPGPSNTHTEVDSSRTVIKVFPQTSCTFVRPNLSTRVATTSQKFGEYGKASAIGNSISAPVISKVILPANSKSNQSSTIQRAMITSKSIVPNRPPNSTVTSTSSSTLRVNPQSKQSPSNASQLASLLARSATNSQQNVSISNRQQLSQGETKCGFFISDLVSIGKIPAERRPNGQFILKFKHNPKYMNFHTAENVDTYITNMVKLVGKRTYGNCRAMNWRFVLTGSEEKCYELFDLQKIRCISNTQYSGVVRKPNTKSTKANQLINTAREHPTIETIITKIPSRVTLVGGKTSSASINVSTPSQCKTSKQASDVILIDD